ncbi:tRNA dihydrouridine synthase DusB [bacterium]|nr:tRNA dihydrouridine synthase DusB [bacterium]MBU1073163.1 tRNA dihydrouridine synthase DusB [bacterium]MBU1676331.1 tRNA dihydrouridine synthase DusB [bacterium]
MFERKPARLSPAIPWFADVRTALSPMSGVSDRAFRDICRDFGAGLAFCEFTAAKGLTYHTEKTWQLIDTKGEQAPVGVQIFGNEPESMAGAARMMRGRRLDVLDINFGCPAKKVVRKCGGSALLADLPLLIAVARAVVAGSPVPVSAKIRTGWDEASVNYREVGLALQDAGCVWVTLHGRTRAQKYSGRANWDRIADLVETLEIPVIGNGDVVDGESYADMVRQTRCHAVMVGRGAMGNPWLFRQMDAAEGLGDYEPPTLLDILDLAKRHIGEDCHLRGERSGSYLVRKHVARYFRGFPGASAIRRELFATETGTDMLAALAEIRRAAERGGLDEPEVRS